ncbi:MAG TPA: VanZ family protein [Rhizomicrobium sp.]|nr:VanZ family protein [Rhizomicrobium sp.]
MIFFQGLFLPWVRRAGAWLFWPAAVVVVWGELTPHPPGMAALLWDKAEHFIAYFGLTLFASLAWGVRRSLAWVFAGVVALGGTLEIIQSFVGRDAEWGDFLANDLGALAGLGMALLYLLVPRRRLVAARVSSH